MACEIISTKGAVFALWGTPTPEDIDQVWAALRAAADECGHPIIYVTRVPVNAPPPDSVARARLDELMPSIASVCSSYHVVLEGEGFGAAIKRGILTGLFHLSWRRKTFFVHANVSQVANNLSREQAPGLRALLELADVRGLLAAPAAAASPT